MFPTSPRATRVAMASVVVTAAVAALAAPLVTQSAIAAVPTSTVSVSPKGSGTTCSTSAPCSLAGGQTRARTLAGQGNSVNVVLADGRYDLTSPLRLNSADSGQGSAVVTYRAAAGATPVLTGARSVTGWTASSLGSNIFQASTPVGLDTRQLYVNGQVAPRAQVAVPNAAVSLSASGFTVNDASLAATLRSVSAPGRLELESIDSFTDRFTPFAGVSGNQVTLAQPAWNNNTYGYDVVQAPFRQAQLYVENAPQLLSAAGQWYIDPSAGKLYYRAAPGQNPSSLTVELPTLQSVVQVSGTLGSPVRNVAFRGVTFTGTSWLHPSSTDGFASQQTGTYLTGADANRPRDAFSSCQVGCPGFEATRGKWGMIAGGVQVSAAQGVSFTNNTFTNLGSQGLGIGNDGGGNASGVDLGAQGVTVTGNTFTQLSGGAVIVGGSQPNAHHPSNPAMTNKNIVVTGNVISQIGVDYKDAAAVFASYVTGLSISNNDIAHVPYTAIAVGFGWGSTDAGGSDEYARRGLYAYYPRYAANNPTTALNYTVTNNYLHSIVTRMNDAGCLYTLGAVPGSRISGNYCTDAGSGNLLYAWPVYLDEGSSNFTVTNNVFLTVPAGLHTNYSGGYSNHNLTADTNYLSATIASCDIAGAPSSTCTNTIPVTQPNLPIAASSIIYNAGLPLPRTADPARPPLGAQLQASKSTVTAGTPVTITAQLADLDPNKRISGVKATLTGPQGWTITPSTKPTTTIPVTGTTSPAWRVSAPATVSAAGAQTFTLSVSYALGADTYSLTRTVAITVTSPVTSLSTYTNGAMQFSQFGSTYSITGSSADAFNGYGTHSDSYGTIYSPKSAGTTSTTTVRVASYDQPVANAKAGIVLRNDLTAPGSSTGYVALVVQGQGVTLFDDSLNDGYLDNQQIDRSSVKTAPIYLRLIRNGAQVTGSWSTDNATWHQVGNPITLSTPNPKLDAGMFYTTTDPNASGTATFDNVAVAGS